MENRYPQKRGVKKAVTINNKVEYHMVQHGRQRVAAHAQNFTQYDAVTFCGMEFIDEVPND